MKWQMGKLIWSGETRPPHPPTNSAAAGGTLGGTIVRTNALDFSFEARHALLLVY